MVIVVHSSSLVRLGGGLSAASCGFLQQCLGPLAVDGGGPTCLLRRMSSGGGGKDLLFWGCFCNFQTSQGSFCKVGDVLGLF
jgi:hypothetical protein